MIFLSAENNFACNARIKAVRETVGLTQRVFAERIGISGPAVAKIETNERNPSEQTLRMICSEFGISRAWLEDGIEPMYAVSSDNDIEIITRAMEGTSEDKKKLIRLLAEMPDELLNRMMEYLRSKL